MKGGKRLLFGLCLLAGGAAILVGFAPGAGATLLPPASGDWTIDAGESSTLSGGTTLVVGNITVNGALTMSGALLELQAPGVGVVPRLFVGAQGVFSLDNATIRAGPSGAARFVWDAAPGGQIRARSTAVQRLGATGVGNLSLVGAHLRGAVVQLYDCSVTDSDGGIGIDEGGTLDAVNLTVAVRARALVLGEGTVGALQGSVLSGSFASTDFLVVVDRATFVAAETVFGNASTLLLFLSGSGHLANATVTRASQTAVLLVGSTLLFEGGLIAPRSDGALGVEAYGSVLTVRATFQNYSLGISALGSTVRVANSSFASSNATPKGGFAGVYGFDSDIAVENTAFNGSYLLTTVPGPTGPTDVFSCSNSALWVVRSRLSLRGLDSFCYADHYHAEDSTSQIEGFAMANGSLGLDLQGGSVQGSGLRGTFFTNSLASAVYLSFSGTTGNVSNIASFSNDVAVEVRDASPIVIDGLVTSSPGLGVRVVARGAPTIRNSTFTVHNATGVLVVDGTPTIENSTFLLTATLMETEGVNVSGGFPRIVGSSFHGGGLLTYGVVANSGSPTVLGSRFESLHRGAVFYSAEFLLEGNTFENCSNGAEARENATGTMRGNHFVNFTEVGAGTGINLYYAASVVEGNTFVRVNYGIKYFWYTRDQPPSGRIQGNSFDQVELFAIELFNVSQALLVDNNTVKHAVRGGIEALFSNVVAAYNILSDSQGYGYDLTESNLVLIGGRLENLSEGVRANLSNVEVRYTTFLLNRVGVIVQDGSAFIANSSFQFNGNGAEFVTDGQVEVNDSLFVGNVHAIWAFKRCDLKVRDTNFVGTLGDVVMTSPSGSSVATVAFTKRGEVNGGRLLLRGSLTSTAETLTLKNVKIQFLTPPSGRVGVSISGASRLILSGVAMANSTTPFYFEVEGSSGSLSGVAMRGALDAPWRQGQGPYFANSTLTLHDVSLNESRSNLTFVDSQVEAFNITSRDNNASGLTLVGSALWGAGWAILDNARCGIVANVSSTVNGTNVTVRGNRGGGLCFNNSRAFVLHGDLSNVGLDASLVAGSDVMLVSTNLARALDVQDSSRLTRAWILDLHVAYPNAALLPSAVVSIVDGQGLALTASPSTSGKVNGLPPLAEKVVTASGEDIRTPYLISASLGSSSASTSVDLTEDRLVQLNLADTTPPEVSIEAPLEGEGFAVGALTFLFAANDSGSGIRDLQYRFGASALTAVAPSSRPFTLVRELVDGDHTFVVRATDFAGNTREVEVNFTVDSRAPLITVVAPRFPANVTKADSVMVQVTVEADVVEVLIAGTQVALVGSSAGRNLSIPEGPSSIRIEARDRVGNRANATIFVSSDRTAPSLIISGGEESTVESWVVVRGLSEPGATVVVGGSTVPTQNGSFEALVYLAPGRNDINVRARDSLGNEASLEVSVTRGVLQPSHVLDIVVQLLGVALAISGAVAAVVVWRRAGRPPTEPARGGEAR